MTLENAIAVCKTCGLPVRVTFDACGEVVKVGSVCGHVQIIAEKDNFVGEGTNDG